MAVRGFAALLAGMVLAALPALAEEYVLPVFAWQLTGQDGNLWSSELYVTNPGADRRLVWPAVFLPGRQGLQTPCLPPIGPLPVPGHSTVLWPAAALARDLGCPLWAVGGLRLESDGPLRITSRMVNQRPGSASGGPLLQGFGQEIAAVPVGELQMADSPALLPALAWHPNACGPRRFESYVYFANPGATEAAVVLQHDVAGTPGDLLIDGREVTTPFALTVPAFGWRQLKVDPVDSPLAVCLPPELADLVFVADVPIAAVASVVDRSVQDARTVTPAAVVP